MEVILSALAYLSQDLQDFQVAHCFCVKTTLRVNHSYAFHLHVHFRANETRFNMNSFAKDSFSNRGKKHVGCDLFYTIRNGKQNQRSLLVRI